MMQGPPWLKPLGVVVAVLTVVLLIAGIVAVPYRFVQPPEGYDQSRLHDDTKNTTRFGGATTADIAQHVSQTVYPATEPTNTPELVILYTPDD